MSNALRTLPTREDNDDDNFHFHFHHLHFLFSATVEIGPWLCCYRQSQKKFCLFLYLYKQKFVKLYGV